MRPRRREAKCRACGANSVELVQDDCHEAVVAWCEDGHVVVYRRWPAKATSLVYDFSGIVLPSTTDRGALLDLLHDRVSQMTGARLRELVEYRLPTYKKKED